MKAVVAAFNQEKALVGAFSVITNLQMELFEALAHTEQHLANSWTVAVACCVAGTTVLFLHKLLPGGKWSLLKVINGCLIGEVMRSPPASRGRSNLRSARNGLHLRGV